MAEPIAHLDLSEPRLAGEASARAESEARTSTRTPLGALLTGAGLVTEEQLEDALEEGTQTRTRLGEVVVGRGWVTEDEVAKLLAEQWQLGYVDRASIWFDASALARMSREQAQKLEALPTRVQDGRVVVAVAEPTEERLAALREVIGDDAVVVVVPKSALDAGLKSELLGAASRSSAASAAAEPDERLQHHDLDEQPQASAPNVPVAQPDAEPITAVRIDAVAPPPPAPPADLPVEIANALERLQEAASSAAALQHHAGTLAHTLERLVGELGSLAADREPDRERITLLEEQLGARTELTERLKSQLSELSRTLDHLG